MTLGDGPVKGQELNSMILMGPSNLLYSMIFMIFCEQQKRADFEETEWNKFNSRSQTFFRNDKIHKKENILSEVWVFLFFVG